MARVVSLPVSAVGDDRQKRSTGDERQMVVQVHLLMVAQHGEDLHVLDESHMAVLPGMCGSAWSLVGR